MSFSPLDAPLEHVLGIGRLLVIAGGPLPLCAWLATRARSAAGLLRTLLTALTLWCVVQADVALLAGVLHRFTPGTVVVTELLLFIAGGVAMRRWREQGRPLIAALHRAVERTDAATQMMVIVLLLTAASLLWHVAALPVVDWDSWAFHLPVMARWLQTGEFVRLEQFAQRGQNGYPYSWEAACALFLMLFGEDAFVTLPNLVTWVLLGLATMAAARDLGAGRRHAIAAAMFVLSMPDLLHHVNTMHVDLPFAAFFMAGVSFLLTLHRHGRRSDLALFVATLGLLCGVRLTGPIYAVALVALCVGLRRAATPPTRAAARGLFPLALFCSLSCLFIGGFWWVKNLAEYGSPLGPLPLTRPAGPFATQQSVMSATAKSLAFAFDPFALASWKQVAERAADELGLPLLIMLAQLALWPAALWANRQPRRQHPRLAGILVVGTGLIFLFTPTSAISGIQLRLGFPWLGALAIAGAAAATGGRLPAVISAALAIAATVMAIGYSKIFWLGAVALVLSRMIGVWRPARIRMAWLTAAIFAGLIVATLVARQQRARNRLEFYGPAFTYLEQNIGENATVGYLLSYRSYHFFGTRLRRHVRYVPPPDGGPTREWFARLRADGIEAVIVGPYEGSAEKPRRTVAGLVPPHGELVPVFGQGQPGEITVYRFADR